MEKEMRVSTPSANKIACRNCAHRDHSVIEINGELKPIGITKCYCRMYPGAPVDNGKPHEVLFNNADCEFYEEE